MDKVLSIVPTFYYDLIARILPGTAFLVALTWNNPLTYGTPKDGPQLVLLIGAGYLAGMFLTAVSLIIDFIWEGCVEYYKKNGSLIGISWTKINPTSLFMITAEIDAIRDKKPDVGDILFKMFAEVTASENMLIGYVIVWVTSSFCSSTALSLTSNQQFWPHLILKVILLIALVVAFLFRVLGLCGRTEFWKGKLEGSYPIGSNL